MFSTLILLTFGIAYSQQIGGGPVGNSSTFPGGTVPLPVIILGASDATIFTLGTDATTAGGMTFNPRPGAGGAMMTWYGDAANNGGTLQMGWEADEFFFKLPDAGVGGANPGIAFLGGQLRYVNFRFDQYTGANLGAGNKGFRVIAYDEDTSATTYGFVVEPIKPQADSGYWRTIFSKPDYSRLNSATWGGDGYIHNFVNITDATAAMIKDLDWKGVSGVKKYELDSSGNMYISGQFKGNFNIRGLATPTAPIVYTVGTAGATTYGYKATAYNADGHGIASAETTIATGNATLDANNYNRIRIYPVVGATSYRVRRTTGGLTQGVIAIVTESTAVDSTNIWYSVNDTGLAGDGVVAETTQTTGFLSATSYFDLYDSTASVYWRQTSGGSGDWQLKYNNTSSRGVDITAGDTIFYLTMDKTITAGADDGYIAGLFLRPTYTAATSQTIVRHNYITLQDVAVAGAGPAAVTDSFVLKLDAALNTHKATTNSDKTGGTKSGTLKVNVNGTKYHIQLYAD